MARMLGTACRTGAAVVWALALMAVASLAMPAEQMSEASSPGMGQYVGDERTVLPPLELERLIEIALEENPELQALRRRIAAAQAKVPQARSLPDPMVGFTFTDALSLDRGLMLEAQQMVPWPGKLRLMSEAAALSADRTVTDYTEKAYEVVAEVKQAYYDLYFIDKSIELTLANKDLLADFVRLAETKYSVGVGIQQDVLRAQVAQSRILEHLLMLRRQRTSARARLNARLNRPPEAPLGPAAELKRRRLTLGQDWLEQTALERRAMLRGMRLMIEETEAMRRLAVRNLKPDYQVMAGVSPGGGMGASGTTVRAGVMFRLPVWHRTKQDEAIQQRAAEVVAAQSSYEAQEIRVFAEIKDLTAVLEESDRTAELLRTGIIPQAELSLESARAGYEVNRVDFLTLLDNQMALYNDLRDYYRAVTDYEKAAARLERTIGTPLDEGVETQPTSAVPQQPQTQPGLALSLSNGAAIPHEEVAK